MKLENEFTVAAPLDQTWDVLLDLPRVASCLPGATIEPEGEEGLYRGQLKMKVGPVNLSYSGTIRPLDVDVDDHVASFEARAKETRGTGTAAAVIRNSLSSDNGSTRVRLETDLDVTGRPAQFGRGLMQDVAGKMLTQFADRLAELMQQQPEAEPSGAAGASPAGSRASEPSAAAQPAAESSAEPEPQLDLGSVLWRGYWRQLAAGVAGVGVIALLGLISRRRRRGFEVTFRYNV